MEAAERDLIDAILAGDRASRVIYADWLEQHGRREDAEWIRLYERAHARGLIYATRELPELASTLDLEWRMQLARAMVESCLDVRCPRDWGSMTAPDGGAIRSCPQCRQRVHYCTDGDQACRADGMIVFDAAADRSWTCPPCGIKNDWSFRYCQACGMRRPGAP